MVHQERPAPRQPPPRFWQLTQGFCPLAPGHWAAAPRRRAPLLRPLGVAFVAAVTAALCIGFSTGESTPPAGLRYASVPDVPGEPIPFGTARYYGALGRKDLGSPVVGMAASEGGSGYWLATANGGVFT